MGATHELRGRSAAIHRVVLEGPGRPAAALGSRRRLSEGVAQDVTHSSRSLRVTVLVATYNQASYLRQALDSLRAQTLAPDAFEVIVINDGCTDATPDILRDYRPWARVVERDNRGLVPSCNEGLAMARGRYFARVDSDDVVASGWLEALLDPLERDPGACCAFSDRYELRGDEKEYR